MNLPPLNRVLFICIFLLGGFFAQAQSIDNVQVTGNSFCPGSSINISFRANDGGIFGGSFDSSTLYDIKLQNSSGHTVFEDVTKYHLSTNWIYPRSIIISLDIKIPNDIPKGTYKAIVSSRNPNTSQAFSSEIDISRPASPEVAVQIPLCIGSPIQLTASRIPDASYYWNGPSNFTSREQNPVITNISEKSIGDYSVVVSVNGCVSEQASVYVDPYPANPGKGDTAGEDFWIGHVYDGQNFERYVGHYTEPEVFDQGFGGNTACFPLSGGVSIYPETYSVKYRMNSSRNGVYSLNLGSDDGGRLLVNGQEVYNAWTDQSYIERSNVLLSLDGESQLEYHFYENGTHNRVVFGEPALLIENKLSTNLEQNLCGDTEPQKISGDGFRSLPSGINKVNTGYQWLYKTSEAGEFQPIPGAISQDFTPSREIDIFKNSGTYYIYRGVILTSTNNIPGKTFPILHISNPAILEVAAPIVNNEISFTPKQDSGTVSKSAAKGQTLYLEAPEGGAFTEVISARFIALGGIINLDATSVVSEYVLGNNFAAIPVTKAIFDRVGWWAILDFRLELEVAYFYTSSTCSGQDLGTIVASHPEGGDGNFTYLWESSTRSASEGFFPAAGENSSQNYTPENLNGTTWFRRTVVSGNCEVTSNVIEIKVQANVWTGTVDRHWNNTANWSCGEIPGLKSNVVIPADVDRFPIITSGVANAKVHNLDIEDGAIVEIQDNWLQIAGNLSNSGSLKATTGSLAFVGKEAQIFAVKGLQENKLANLYIDNTAGLRLQGKLGITHSLKVQKGHFNTGNAFSLLSDARGTALIDGSGMGEVIGEVTLQRYLDKAFGYKYFCSPLLDAKVGDFAGYVDLKTSFPNFYRYNENRKGPDGEDASGWEAYTDASLPLQTLHGYAINFGTEKEPLTISITGTVNDGPQLIPLKNNHGKYTQGFNLVGNPYPSPINWDAEGWTKHNIDDAIYFFTASEDSQYMGTYRSYVAGVSSQGSTSTESNIIPSMQGFFVHVSDTQESPVTATLGMTNQVRVVDFEQEFYKSARNVRSLYPIVRLSAGFDSEERQDPAVIYFSNTATPDFDKEVDALKMMNTDSRVPNLYSLTPSKQQLSINALPSQISGEIRVPLGLQAERSGNMRLQLRDLEGLPANLKVYLIDLEKRISKELHPGTEYSFHINQGVHNARFELLLTEEVLDDVAKAFHDPFSVSSKGGSLYVKLNLEEGQEGRITVTSLSGQSLAMRQASGKETVQINGINGAGIYVVSLELEDARHTKKVLIGNE